MQTIMYKSGLLSRVEPVFFPGIHRSLAVLRMSFLGSVTLPGWIPCLLSNLPHTYLMLYEERGFAIPWRHQTCPDLKHVICNVPIAGNISSSQTIHHPETSNYLPLSLFCEVKIKLLWFKVKINMSFRT